MISRSLRWRLQLWHALLLTTVLVLFGGAVYALQWQTRVQQASADLDRYASVLASRLRGLFPVPRMPGLWPPRNPGRSGSPRNDDSAADGGSADVADALLPANVFPLPPPPRDPREPRNQGSRGGRDGRRDGNRDEGRNPRDVAEGPRPESRSAGRPDAAQMSESRPRPSGTDSPRESSGRDQPGRESSARDLASRGQPGRDQSGRDGAGRDQTSRDQSAREGRNPWFDPPPGLGLPDEFMHLFEGDENNSYYFMIWNADGDVLEKSKSLGEIPFPDLHAKDGLPERSTRMRDLRLEVIHVTRFDINVLVGRSLQPDIAALHRSALFLGMLGLGVLVIGLAGGWWFTSRAIRPIAEILATAESISVKNLSQRINTKSTATELEQLATVLNRTFDRLQSAFQRQGQFTADASHELRTPVSVILSHAELALSRPRSGEEYQKALQACHRASLRMKTLIDSLLVLARLDSGETELKHDRVEIDQVAQDAAEMLLPLAEEKQVQLTCRTENLVVEGDQDRLFQVISNLLTNAVRYNKPDGRVELVVTAENNQAVIRVSDTGVGIPAEDLPRIFDRFYRVDKARSQAEGGCGLGLAICSTIVETHGGTISATSQPGTGTTVEVRLPCISRKSGIVESLIRREPEVAGSVR